MAEQQTEEKQTILKTIRNYALILALFTAFSGGILSFVHLTTAEKIASNAVKQRALAQKAVFAEAKTFKEAQKNNFNYVEAFDSEKTPLGYIIEAENQGYSSVIKTLIALDSSFKIVGLKIVSQTETPGLGTNIEKNKFTEQFINKKNNELDLKQEGGNIDAVTGATISSRAVINSVKSAIENFKNALTYQEPIPVTN